MKALVIDEPGKAGVKEIQRPAPKAGEVLIRVASCGVCGTDVHIFKGEYDGSYPIVPGHEFSGTVVERGPGVVGLEDGDRVCVEPNLACGICPACLSNRENFCESWQAVGVTRAGGMAEYVAVPESAVFKIGSLPFETAAFVEPLSCVLHGVERAGVAAGDRALVLGAGPIGLLLMRSVQAAGASEVTVAERNPVRLRFAEKAGAASVSPDADSAGGNFDLVVDATGNPAVWGAALRYARKGGRILLFGVPPKGSQVQFDAFSIFRGGLSIFSSFTSVRNTFQAIRMLEAGRIRVDDLVSHRLPLGEFPDAVKLLASGGDVMKVMMVPGK